MIFTIFVFIYVDSDGSAMRLIYDYCRTKYLNEVLVGNVCLSLSLSPTVCVCIATCNCADERAMMCFTLFPFTQLCRCSKSERKTNENFSFSRKMCNANGFLVSAKSNA